MVTGEGGSGLPRHTEVKVLGYADRLSLTFGDRVRFMVSAEVPRYRADIVRLRRPDHPRWPAYTEEVVDSAVNGDYCGRQQTIHTGSYIRVDEAVPSLFSGFSLQTWIYPTTPKKGETQGLLTKWSASERSGFALIITETGELALRLGVGNGEIEEVRSGASLQASEWYFVACTYDGKRGRIVLLQECLTQTDPSRPKELEVERHVTPVTLNECEAPLLIAGYCTVGIATSEAYVRGLYNGKIENPRVYSCALSKVQLQRLKEGASPQGVGGGLVAAWNFAENISAAQVRDIASGQPLGEAVNAPMRAVTGHNWDGTEVDYKVARDQYGAIHFHEDDLEDAGWEADFELEVTDQFRSGVYAARLIGGGYKSYIPFFVRPKLGCPSAEIAFLAPTNTYVAYANERIHETVDLSTVVEGPIALSDEDEYLADHPEFGASLYDLHSDNTGNAYSSRLRPILNMSPNYQFYATETGVRHFAADLNLVDWLEEQGHDYDTITDEDLHLHRLELLAPYKVVITGTHPEYWTYRMISALEEYLNGGGKLMYLGGNGFYWVTGMDDERPHLVEVRRGTFGTTSNSESGEAYLSTTGELGGLWRHRGRAPQRIVGIGTAAVGSGKAPGYRRTTDSRDPRVSFIFRGVEDDELIGDFGMALGGAAGDEIDRLDYNLGTPPQTLLLATSSGMHNHYYKPVLDNILASAPGQGGSDDSKVRADMVYFERAGGGAVFSVGSITWCASLPHNKFNNNVSTITRNVLRHFLYGSAPHNKERLSVRAVNMPIS